jgi:ABC-type transport system involved in cytochrome bd biosynthesis fused ATPase/permease subunit
VADNLLLGRPEATGPEVARALAAARLEAWVAGLPAGLDTPVGPGGTEVSGGERRRLSLARALLAGFPILIADEPTAGLDPEAAAGVVATLVATGESRGLLLITHGAEGLEEMDEIVVLDRGRVAERGTHAALLAAGGGYTRFWAARQAAST